MYNLGETICLKKKYWFPGVDVVVVVMLLNLWNTPTPINKKKQKNDGKTKEHLYIYCKIIASLLQKYQRVTLCFLIKIQWKLYGN